MKLKTAILFIFSAISFFARAQVKDTSVLKISGYVDTYISSFTNELDQQTFQPYTTSGARGNTFGVNIAQIGMHYTSNNIRGNFIYHDGDIPQATWSSNFTNLQEANAGFKLGKRVWFDMGFFSTHIGTESFLPKENMLGQTSFITYNEPFYQAGAKLSFELKRDWDIELWVANGYNRHVDNNKAKSVGILVNKEFSESTSITYTNLYGRESEEDAFLEQFRFYQNLYLNQSWGKKLFLSAGVDLALQTNSQLDNPTGTATMYAGLVTMRYQFKPKYSITARYEFSNDEDGFINDTIRRRLFPTRNVVTEGINLYGFTLGGEYKPNENSYVRLEGRYLQTGPKQNIFLENERFVNERYEVLFTIGFFIDKSFRFKN